MNRPDERFNSIYTGTHDALQCISHDKKQIAYKRNYK